MVPAPLPSDVEIVQPQGVTYNLTVDIGHTFYVGNLKTWVHNTGNCLQCGAGGCSVHSSEFVAGKEFAPKDPVSVSDTHSVQTITEKTRFGAGNRNTPKSIALGGIDVKGDIAEINSGKARVLEGGDIMTSSGRVYGTHPESSTIFPRSGPGLIQVTQAEFDLYKTMLRSGGLKGDALKQFEGLLKSGNKGVSEATRQKLTSLYESSL